MTAHAVLRAIRKPVAVAFAVLVLVAGAPLIGAVGLAAWQQHDPASLRLMIHELSILTEADSAGGVMDNMIAAFAPGGERPG